MALPRRYDQPDLVESWLAEVSANPLEESEVSEFRSSSNPNHDPLVALQIDRDGVPLWWPNKHHRTGEGWSRERRRNSFLEWLRGVWSVRGKKILLGSQAYRRRRLAIELVCLQAEMPEALEQMWDERPRGEMGIGKLMASRERAIEVATDVAKTMGKTLRQVVDLEELQAQGVRLPSLYGVDLSDCWIAYLETRTPWALRSSDIVVIEKATGAVRYKGSANDEG